MRRDFDKGVPFNIAPQRGETAASTAKPRAWQVSPFLSTISFVSSKEIVRTKASHLLRHADAQKSEGIL